MIRYSHLKIHQSYVKELTLSIVSFIIDAIVNLNKN